MNQKGFIQIPILIAIIVGILVLGGGGYFGVKQYQSYQSEKVEQNKQIELNKKTEEEQRQKLQASLDSQNKELEKQKSEIEVLKNKKPEIITNTIIKEIPAPTLKVEDDLPSIIKQWRPVIAYIECRFLYGDATGGSGLALHDPSSGIFMIWTNAHVVGGEFKPESCKIIFPGSNSPPLISTKILISISGRDLGRINIDDPDEHFKNITSIPLNFCPKNRPVLGDKIVILGYPSIGSKTDITATEGIISGRDGNYFITSAKIERGNSGGVAILVKDNCYFGVPSFAQVGDIESLGRILDIYKP